MLSALWRNKVGQLALDEISRAEDALTSTVFDSLRWGPTDQGLLPFLRRAQPFQETRLDEWLQPGTQASIALWPKWRERVIRGRREVDLGDGEEESLEGSSYKEPDVLVSLQLPDGRRGWLLVEAKLYASKSSFPDDSDVPGDQLGRYWWHLSIRARAAGAEPLGVVFLTTHLAMPVDDLEETANELRRKNVDAAPLYWLSWRDFVSAVESSAPGVPALADAASSVRDLWAQQPIRMRPWAPPMPLPADLRFGWRWQAPPPIQNPWSFSTP